MFVPVVDFNIINSEEKDVNKNNTKRKFGKTKFVKYVSCEDSRFIINH